MLAMSNQENRHDAPPLPERSDSLPANITFIVGPDKIPFHLERSRLADSNSIFRAMLSENWTCPLADTGGSITLGNINDRAFDNLIRRVYLKMAAKLQTVRTALDSLSLAHQFFCVDLVKDCVQYLDGQLRPENVLEIYQTSRCLCDGRTPAEIEKCHQPSAPSYEALLHTPSAPDTEHEEITRVISHLHQNCLQMIDQNSDEILVQEQLEDVSSEELVALLSRDTFHVANGEFGIHEAVFRWAKRECRRNGLSERDNLRAVVNDSVRFIPRYLLMSTDDIVSGPMDSSLLDQTESAYLLKHHRMALDDPAVPKSLVGRLDYLKRPRIVLKTQPRSSGFREAATKFLGGRHWSTKNNNKNCHAKSKLIRHGGSDADAGVDSRVSSPETKKRKKVKRKKEEERARERIREREEGGKLSPKRSGSQSSTATCMLDCLCRALSCIFD